MIGKTKPVLDLLDLSDRVGWLKRAINTKICRNFKVGAILVRSLKVYVEVLLLMLIHR